MPIEPVPPALDVAALRISAATLHQSHAEQSAGLLNSLIGQIEQLVAKVQELETRNAVLDAAVTKPAARPRKA